MVRTAHTSTLPALRKRSTHRRLEASSPTPWEIRKQAALVRLGWTEREQRIRAEQAELRQQLLLYVAEHPDDSDAHTHHGHVHAESLRRHQLEMSSSWCEERPYPPAPATTA